MLKLPAGLRQRRWPAQPPSGGCVLKRFLLAFWVFRQSQPPSGGCVLKRASGLLSLDGRKQPPSGGCVLKHYFSAKAESASGSRLRAAVC